MRFILNVINKFEFMKYDCNFGFKPKLACQNAMFATKKSDKEIYFAIERDNRGTYHNINFDKLIEILKPKIDYKDFINLVKNGLNCGVMIRKFLKKLYWQLLKIVLYLRYFSIYIWMNFIKSYRQGHNKIYKETYNGISLSKFALPQNANF